MQTLPPMIWQGHRCAIRQPFGMMERWNRVHSLARAQPKIPEPAATPFVALPGVQIRLLKPDESSFRNSASRQ